MIWGYGIMGLILALLWWQNGSLKEDIKEQNALNKIAIEANERWEAEISKLNSEFAKGLETLSELKSKKEVERVYVKEVSSNTNSCIDAINAVYERLWHQSGDSNTSTSSSTKDTKAAISAK